MEAKETSQFLARVARRPVHSERCSKFKPESGGAAGEKHELGQTSERAENYRPGMIPRLFDMKTH